MRVVWANVAIGQRASQLEAADVPSLRSVVARCRVRSHSASISLLIEIPAQGLNPSCSLNGLTVAGSTSILGPGRAK